MNFIVLETVAPVSGTKMGLDFAVGILGGVAGAFLNFLFTKGKTKAETEKLYAEAEKLRAETQKVLGELSRFQTTVQQTTDKLSGNEQVIIYDGTKDLEIADFQSFQEHFHGESETAPRGKGSLSMENGVILVRRTNNVGRFRIKLIRYCYNDVNYDYLPKNEMLSGKRQLKLRAEFKAVSASHSILFQIKDKATGRHLDTSERTFTRNEWTKVEIDFRIEADKDCDLWMDDKDVTSPQSSLQIKSLVLTERLLNNFNAKGV